MALEPCFGSKGANKVDIENVSLRLFHFYSSPVKGETYTLAPVVKHRNCL